MAKKLRKCEINNRDNGPRGVEKYDKKINKRGNETKQEERKGGERERKKKGVKGKEEESRV